PLERGLERPYWIAGSYMTRSWTSSIQLVIVLCPVGLQSGVHGMASVSTLLTFHDPGSNMRDRYMSPSPWRLDVYAVDLDRRVMEHRRAFGRRVGPGEPFERVVQHVIRKGDFVRRKVAFEHATLRTEVLNTVLHPRRHGFGQCFRADRHRPGVPVEPHAGHAHTAQFEGDIGTSRHRGDPGAPDGAHLVLPVGIHAHPIERADVIQNDRYIRHSPGEVGHFRHLGKRDHDIQGPPLVAQDLRPFPEGRVGQDALALPVVHRGAWTPGDVMPYAPKSVGARRL